MISSQYGNLYMFKDFTFHDLKAKGISDYEGRGRDKQLFSGHKTEGQVLIYDRKVKISPILDVPLPINIRNCLNYGGERGICPPVELSLLRFLRAILL